MYVRGTTYVRARLLHVCVSGGGGGGRLNTTRVKWNKQTVPFEARIWQMIYLQINQSTNQALITKQERILCGSVHQNAFL